MSRTIYGHLSSPTIERDAQIECLHFSRLGEPSLILIICDSSPPSAPYREGDNDDEAVASQGFFDCHISQHVIHPPLVPELGSIKTRKVQGKALIRFCVR